MERNSEQEERKKIIEADLIDSPWYERTFESFLWGNRLWVLFAVVSALIAAIALFIIGTLDVLDVVGQLWKYYILGDHAADIHATAVSEIIGAVDLYLIAIVMLLFSFGIYELFVSQIDAAAEHSSSKILEIHSLDELKDKVAKVIIMVLVVKYFQMVLDMKFDGPLEMLYLAGSILALSLALYFLHKGGEH